MLTYIHITHLITISELNLELRAGTSVVTGETGAGKSILIDAILLALGDRAASNLVRLGEEKADISLSFDISTLSHAQTWLKDRDLDKESISECILRRVLYSDGRSRSYINGMPATLQSLRELSELLIQIHGQHEHQSLLKLDKQREYLDHYANHPELLNKINAIAIEHQQLEKKIIQLRGSFDTSASRSEFLQFQLKELEELNLQENEFTELEKEHRQVAHADELLQAINQTQQYVSQSESTNIIALLHQSQQLLEKIRHTHTQIPLWLEQLNTVFIQMKEFDNELGKFLEKFEINPERFAFLEERIRILFDVARKHKINPAELFAFQKKLADEYNMLNKGEAEYQLLTQQLNCIKKEYSIVADQLTISRQKAAKKLAQAITKIIRELSLPAAEFSIHVGTLHEENNFSIHGRDHILFQIKTHAKQPLQSIAKVVSGGELSRIALAIYIATASTHAAPALIFDEVDVGIGGGTAEIVGKLLRKLGETHQVICITHQPQVAALGHQHILVSKLFDEKAPLTQMKTLSQSEKIQELARMLGGVEITHHVLEHAKEMVGKADQVCV